MFNKKTCKKCRESVKGDYEFCPQCGTQLNDPKTWGMLGKNDFQETKNDFPNSLFGGITGNMLNKMIGSAMKMIENEMQKEIQQSKYSQNKPQTKTNLQLYVNGKKINLNGNQSTRIKKPIKQQFSSINFSQEKLKKFLNLPREEPATTIRRLSDRIIYEINLPGVKSKKDISIIRLENSIELKAIAKDKSYIKIIPVDLPLIDYQLSKEKLILELEAKN